MKRLFVRLIATVVLCLILVPLGIAEAAEGRIPPDGDFEQALQIGTPGHVFQHGNEVGLNLSTEQVHSGNYSLLVTDRTVPWGGPGWDVKEHLKEKGWGNWYVSAYVRSVEPIAMQMYFSIYCKYNDGTEDWLTSNTNVTFGNDGWIRVNADAEGNPVKLVSATGITPDFDELEIATLYMCTGDGQLNDFYIDDVELYKDQPWQPPVQDPQDEENPETGYESNFNIVLLVIVSAGMLVIAIKKKRSFTA